MRKFSKNAKFLRPTKRVLTNLTQTGPSMSLWKWQVGGGEIPLHLARALFAKSRDGVVDGRGPPKHV